MYHIWYETLNWCGYVVKLTIKQCHSSESSKEVG